MSARTLPPGESLGVAGGGLDDADWAADADAARIGQRGERATADILDRFCAQPGGATVLHDVTIPGSRANIDHLVVTGGRVWIIDSKVWRPGFYWRVGQRAFRGLRRFAPAEKQTNALAARRLAAHLQRELGRSFDLSSISSTTVAWPSRDTGRLTTLLLGRVGSSPLVGARTFRWLTSSMIGTRSRLGFRRNRAADPRIVGIVSRLLVTPTCSRIDWEAAEYVAARDVLATATATATATSAEVLATHARYPAGSPHGGRFAPTRRAEPPAVLPRVPMPPDPLLPRDPFGDDRFGERC